MGQHNPSSNLWPALFVASLLHLALWFWLPLGSILKETDKLAQSPEIEVQKWVDSEMPVVKSSKAINEADAENEKLRFSGEFKNRVKKEVQSPLKGRFFEGQPPAGDDSPLAEEGEKRPGKPSLADLMPFGATPNKLPDDIANGNQTVLNSDPVIYASFTNRIADVIYDPWVKFARQAVSNVETARNLASNVYVTKLLVMLNPEGEVTGIQTIKSCGVAALDDAPKRAFWESEKFPNPPSQMIKDGMIKFFYEFHFEWKTSSFNIIPWSV